MPCTGSFFLVHSVIQFLIMDITPLITGIFGGFLGTMVVNYFTKDLDFKYDYKKYILKKRQDAYDEIEKILAEIGSEATDDYYNSIPSVFSTASTFWEFQNNIAITIVKYKVWLSNEILSYLYQIQIINGNVYMDYETSDRSWSQNFITIIVQKHYDPLFEYSQRLYEIFFDDIRELDNIKRFKKNKVME